jgi:hypothetical protein
LTDIVEKYHAFHMATGDPQRAERLFTAAMNLAESRRGGLFVVLNDAAAVRLLAPEDLLENTSAPKLTKARFHYLLSGKSLLELDLEVLQSVARIDGGIVLDRAGRLLAFGAILRRRRTPGRAGGRPNDSGHACLPIRFGAQNQRRRYRVLLPEWGQSLGDLAPLTKKTLDVARSVDHTQDFNAVSERPVENQIALKTFTAPERMLDHRGFRYSLRGPRSGISLTLESCG